jgi:hypothetical protein
MYARSPKVVKPGFLRARGFFPNRLGRGCNGHGSQMVTPAEGVETEEQRNKLRQLGCSLMQGYLFSPAMPACNSSSFLPNLNHRPEPTGSQAPRSC